MSPRVTRRFSTDDGVKTVTFIQFDIPPLEAGTYTISVSQTVNQQAAPFSSTAQFVVTGERFSLDPNEISSVFPPNLANGELTGVLPHVVFSRRTLPWERPCVAGNESAPWMTILLFNDGQQPQSKGLTAADLVPDGQTITVEGSTITGTGRLPANMLSYPGYTRLEIGELPTDPCTCIDVPAAMFSSIAPSAADLPYLAHIREVDTTNTVDATTDVLQSAVVLGNRIPQANASSWCFLVSLENMGPYLPGADGTPSSQIPDGTQFVRLVVFQAWRYFTNDLGDTFQKLLENLNKTPGGQQGLTSLQFPFDGTPPTAAQVQVALAHQASGTTTDDDADVLVRNAFTMGYVPFDHQLREVGNTVSWYRGPLIPYPVQTTIEVPASCPDALNQYDPTTGMFDVSYGAAWQLGQLLALQNRSFALALYNWKQTLDRAEAVAAEQAIIEERLQRLPILESFIRVRAERVANLQPVIPPDIDEWLNRLRLLSGVPFQYFVPDDTMLPPESLRFFQYDFNWIDALADGAFSIGRVNVDDLRTDARHTSLIRRRTMDCSSLRRNPRVRNAAVNDTEQVTGFLLRSQLVSGWPNVVVNGYSDAAGTAELAILRMVRLSDTVLLCIFDGAVAMVAIHEPPAQLHCGIETVSTPYTTTLRAVTANTPGFQPGQQFLSDPKGGLPVAQIPMRSDQQTVMVQSAATSIETRLNTDFGQGITAFTSAEFTLEMIKGVVKVEFQQQ